MKNPPKVYTLFVCAVQDCGEVDDWGVLLVISAHLVLNLQTTNWHLLIVN